VTIRTFDIAGRTIGGPAAPYVIAEIGINHGGDLQTARKLLAVAKRCGVDAAKLQAFVPDKFLARSSTYFDLLAGCALSGSAIRELMAYANEIGLTLFSAVFDEESADLLQSASAPAFKIASGDLTHLPLLRHVARFSKPMLISSGGGTMDEIKSALDAVRGAAPYLPVALFHCVSNYPTDPRDCNLACMATIRAEFGVPVGFSDHTLGHAVPIAAAALGADLIEKHFTLDRNADGPDHALSLDPEGMGALVQDLRGAREAVGRVDKAPVEAADFIPQIRRSVAAFLDIQEGTVIERSMLAIKRPGTGIAPNDIDKVVGKRAARPIAADAILAWSDLV
jgi:N-acetylneuraminate synthase/N,N'-diacetyllegionaminate synthase